MITVAALFVDDRPGGAYVDVPGVEVWGVTKDARNYAGPHPVVCHSPCSRWCQLAFINQKRYGHTVGDDGGCFAAALAAVRRFGGVLEHPAFSYAWPHFALTRPARGVWRYAGPTGHGLHEYVTEVSQSAYGHRARKRTWLLYVTDDAPPHLDWSEPAPTAQVSFCKNHGDSPLPRLSKREAAATPLRFKALLLNLARHSRTDIYGRRLDTGAA